MGLNNQQALLSACSQQPVLQRPHAPYCPGGQCNGADSNKAHGGPGLEAEGSSEASRLGAADVLQMSNPCLNKDAAHLYKPVLRHVPLRNSHVQHAAPCRSTTPPCLIRNGIDPLHYHPPKAIECNHIWDRASQRKLQCP